MTPDEIALNFDDAFSLVETLVGEGRLGRGALPDLREIDAALHEMSGPENTADWTREALTTGEGWHRARRAARRVLVAELGTWQRPLPHVTVIR
ncbi:hypothetical protein H7K43_31510 [Streptomyces sp. TYQ1024]|nr:hypothetical protein [Streptomyces sp. TYQ1024]